MRVTLKFAKLLGTRKLNERITHGVLTHRQPQTACNLNTSKPSEHPPSGGKLSRDLGGNILAVGTKTLNGIKRVPQCSHIGSTV